MLNGEAVVASGERELKLNLGACDRAFEGFTSVDLCPPADIVTDLALPWPWEDSTVSEVRAHDVIEHIEDFCRCCAHLRGGVRSGRIHFWNELHRVLKPGGIATIETPNAARGAGFYQDPTHANPFCLNSFQYIQDKSFAVQRLAASYGVTARFEILDLDEAVYRDTHEDVWKITAVLKAIKKQA